MDKLNRETPNLVDSNLAYIAARFPNAVTEALGEDGKPERKIDFDVLRQELSKELVEGPKERYQFTWPDKRKSIQLANEPTDKTLRPVPERSVGRDGTEGAFDSENIYIEGDNLDALKILRDTYLGKVKMIYIDPPYNTGSDFIYKDDFSQDRDEYVENSGQVDDLGNRFVQNVETNGRFHTDWLNMIYPRLMLARDLLSNDGVIFISIDDNEMHNVRKVCDEIFGASNFIGAIIQNKLNAKNDSINLQKNHEYIVIYRRSTLLKDGSVLPSIMKKTYVYKDVFEENGEFFYINDSITTRGDGGTLNARPKLGNTIYFNPNTNDIIGRMDYDEVLAKTSNDENLVYVTDQELVNNGYVPIRPPRVRGKLGCWTWSLEKINAEKRNLIVTGKPGKYAIKKRTFVDKQKVAVIDGRLQYQEVYYTNAKSV